MPAAEFAQVLLYVAEHVPYCVVPHDEPDVLHEFQYEVPHWHEEVHGALYDIVPAQDPEPHEYVLEDVKVFPSHASPDSTTPLPHIVVFAIQTSFLQVPD